MPGQYEDLFAKLAARFRPDEEKTLTKGKQITYVTARTVMNRLDSVLGAENWWDDYTVLSADSILCRLTIRLPDGSTLTKCDCGGAANMKDAGDDDKSMVSDAIKRAAGRFGVGRYLYGDGVAPYVIDELTRARDERQAKKHASEAPLDSRAAVNETFSPAALDHAEAPPGPPERPANDREKVKLASDRIGAKGLDVRAWYKILDQQVEAANRAMAFMRKEHGLAPVEATNSYEVTGHMVKWAVENGADNPRPIGPDGKPKKVGIGVLTNHLNGLYAAEGWRDPMRRELKRYVAVKYNDAEQLLDNEANGDKPGPDEESGGQLATVGADDDEGLWEAGRQ